MTKQRVITAAVAMMAGAVLAAQMEVGVCAYSFRKVTAFEAIEKAKACGADVIELFFWQKLSPEHPNVTLNQHLSDAHIAALKAKLDAVGIKAVNAYVADFGKTEEETRKLFTFAQKLGLRGLTGEWRLVVEWWEWLHVSIITPKTKTSRRIGIGIRST